ncbi:HIT domain-containing protein [Rickettsiales bacterium LUAb2]
MYDTNNIFAKILRNEIACKKVYEDNYSLAFYDIFPKKKIHVLVIPKGEYMNLGEFTNKASHDEIVGYFKAISKVIEQLQLINGYRLISNCDDHGRQEVKHLHFHILAGEDVGNMVCKHS